MVNYGILRCTLLYVSVATPADAATFLPARAQVTREDVKQFLLSELSGHVSGPRLDGIEKELRPMYIALPKSETGRLEPPTVRYALHRFFVQRHGWYVKGLDNAGSAWNESTGTTVLKHRAPVYIQSLFEEHLHGLGLGLHELAVFAATLEDLIHAETTGKLEWIYAALRLPLVGPVAKEQADLASHYYVVAYLTIISAFAKNQKDLESMESRLRDEYPDFIETSLWAKDLRQANELELSSRRNPFVEHIPSFDDSLAFASAFGHQFGSFQNLECHKLKEKLVDLEHFGTGRVPLSIFYSHALAGAWEFMESIEYLRNQGALDETDPARPSVVIANYINSQTNCLAGSDFYQVCCINECEGLMTHIERQIEAPSGEPARIAQVTSSLPSDTVDAPRNLSAALVSRLEEIAHLHSGRIPLHGRLFAQWMHHAYPRECPFPHVSGTTTPLSQEEWVEQFGAEGLSVGRDVMEKHASQANMTSVITKVLPWTVEEELVAENKQTTTQKRRYPLVHMLVFLAALVSFAVPLMRVGKGITSNQVDKLEKHLV